MILYKESADLIATDFNIQHLQPVLDFWGMPVDKRDELAANLRHANAQAREARFTFHVLGAYLQAIGRAGADANPALWPTPGFIPVGASPPVNEQQEGPQQQQQQQQQLAIAPPLVPPWRWGRRGDFASSCGGLSSACRASF